MSIVWLNQLHRDSRIVLDASKESRKTGNSMRSFIEAIMEFDRLALLEQVEQLLLLTRYLLDDVVEFEYPIDEGLSIVFAIRQFSSSQGENFRFEIVRE